MTSSWPAPIFIIGSIHIKSVEDASCVNFGNNYLSHFQSYKKQNQGFGTVNGDHSQIVGTKSTLDQTGSLDWLDKNNKEFPKWLKKGFRPSEPVNMNKKW